MHVHQRDDWHSLRLFDMLGMCDTENTPSPPTCQNRSNCEEAEGKREAFRFRRMTMQEEDEEQVRGWERDNEGVVTIESWMVVVWDKERRESSYPNLGSVGIPTPIRFLSSCSPLSLRLPRHRAHCAPALPVKPPRRFFPWPAYAFMIPRVLLHKRLGINVGFD